MSGRATPAVVHFADYGGEYSGNFVASVRSLKEPCRSLGFRLVLAFSDPGDRPWLDELRAEGIGVHVLDRAAPLPARVRAVARIAKAENAALIHTHYTRWDVPGAIAAALGGVPVVWHLHSPFPPLRGARFVTTTAVKFRALARRAHLAAVSEEIQREAVRRGCPARRAHYVPNSVDIPRVTRPSAGRDQLRRDLGLSPSAQVALAFGWDPARKGVDLALAAGRALASGGREFVLLLVGAEALEAFVAERIGAQTPAWLRMLRPRERVADFYAAADLFLSPSRAEGFPYALGEALANGLPSVTSDIPGVEWARQLDAAEFCPSGDAAALTEAIARVLDRPPARRAAAGAEARAYAAANLSLEAWAERVVAVYRSALAERGVQPDQLRAANAAGATAPRAAARV